MQPEIETDRLILREIRETDENGMWLLDSDPEVHRFLGNSPVQNIEQVRDVIRLVRDQYAELGIGRWAVIEKATGHFAGWSGLKFVKEKNHNQVNYYDLGYRLRREFWGKGYATESAVASLKYAFQIMKLAEVFAWAETLNYASNAVLIKSGMQLLDSFTENGRAQNWYRIDRSQWIESGL